MNHKLRQFFKRAVPELMQVRIRELRLRWQLRSFNQKQVEHEYYGCRFRIHIRDEIASRWYDRDWESMPELDLLRTSQLREGACVFDIGAHQGVVAMMLARQVGDNGLVVAVEGSAHNAALAVENRDTNRIKNVAVVHAVAAEREAVGVPFSRGLNGAVVRSAAYGQIVPSVSVDSLMRAFRAPDVIFIDVEGFECQVLRGAVGALTNLPDVFVEVHRGCGLENHGSFEEVREHFPEVRYRLFWCPVEDQVFRPLDARFSLPQTAFYFVALKRASRWVRGSG